MRLQICGNGLCTTYELIGGFEMKCMLYICAQGTEAVFCLCLCVRGCVCVCVCVFMSISDNEAARMRASSRSVSTRACFRVAEAERRLSTQTRRCIPCRLCYALGMLRGGEL